MRAYVILAVMGGGWYALGTPEGDIERMWITPGMQASFDQAVDAGNEQMRVLFARDMAPFDVPLVPEPTPNPASMPFFAGALQRETVFLRQYDLGNGQKLGASYGPFSRTWVVKVWRESE